MAGRPGRAIINGIKQTAGIAGEIKKQFGWLQTGSQIITGVGRGPDNTRQRAATLSRRRPPVGGLRSGVGCEADHPAWSHGDAELMGSFT